MPHPDDYEVIEGAPESFGWLKIQDIPGGESIWEAPDGARYAHPPGKPLRLYRLKRPRLFKEEDDDER